MRTLSVAVVIVLGALAWSGHAAAAAPAIRLGSPVLLGRAEVTDLRWVVPVGEDRIVIIRGRGRHTAVIREVGEARLGDATPLEGLVTPPAGIATVVGLDDGLLLVDREGALSRQRLDGARLGAPVPLSGRMTPHFEVLRLGDYLLGADTEERMVASRLEGDRIGPPEPVGACCRGRLASQMSNPHKRHVVYGSTILFVSARGRVFGQTWSPGQGLGSCGLGTAGPEVLQHPALRGEEPVFDFADQRTRFVVSRGRLLVVRPDGEVHAVPLAIEP